MEYGVRRHGGTEAWINEVVSDGACIPFPGKASGEFASVDS